MTQTEKLHVARQLQAMRVDVIEAGFPIASPGDFEAVKAVAEEIKDVRVAGLARALKEDIDCAAAALKNCAKPRIHVFLATSEIHRQFKLKKAQDEILKQAAEMVVYARTLCEDIEFSPEDASRTEPDFLARVVEAVIAAGASTVNIPDTVGYSVPDEFGRLIAGLFRDVPNIEKAIISVHCHNDLGLAVANSLAAVRSGARQVECTVNGIGERAGNCSMEEVVMALHTRRDSFGITTGIETRQIVPASRLVSGITGSAVQRNKAIVGENAFSHEAGIHQDGILKERSTYEIMKPEDVGWDRSRLVLGKHSGKHAFRTRCEQLGFTMDNEKVLVAFKRFKELADRKKNVWDEDIEAILWEIDASIPRLYALKSYNTVSGTGVIPTAAVRIRDQEGKERIGTATGDGPVDALYQAIDRVLELNATLKDYGIRAVTSGKDALGEVIVELQTNGFIERGKASSPDIIEASANAYMHAANKLVSRMRQREREPSEPILAQG